MVIPGNGGYAQHRRSPMVLLIIRERFRHIFLMEKYNEENSMPPITTYAGELEAKANQDEIRMLSVQYVSTELLCSGIN